MTMKLKLKKVERCYCVTCVCEPSEHQRVKNDRWFPGKVFLLSIIVFNRSLSCKTCLWRFLSIKPQSSRAVTVNS